MNGSPDNTGEDDVVIARIVKPHGIRGEVACDIETGFLERFEIDGPVKVRMRDGAILNPIIEDRRFVKNRILLKFEGYDTMDAARGLVGGLIVINASDRMALDQDEFYEYELVGLEMVTAEGRRCGRVTGLISTGAAPVLVIEGDDGGEILVPFTDAICPDVDLNSKRITVNPPEGLLELNTKPRGDSLDAGKARVGS